MFPGRVRVGGCVCRSNLCQCSLPLQSISFSQSGAHAHLTPFSSFDISQIESPPFKNSPERSILIVYMSSVIWQSEGCRLHSRPGRVKCPWARHLTSNCSQWADGCLVYTLHLPYHGSKCWSYFRFSLFLKRSSTTKQQPPLTEQGIAEYSSLSGWPKQYLHRNSSSGRSESYCLMKYLYPCSFLKRYNGWVLMWGNTIQSSNLAVTQFCIGQDQIWSR